MIALFGILHSQIVQLHHSQIIVFLMIGLARKSLNFMIFRSGQYLLIGKPSGFGQSRKFLTRLGHLVNRRTCIQAPKDNTIHLHIWNPYMKDSFPVGYHLVAETDKEFSPWSSFSKVSGFNLQPVVTLALDMGVNSKSIKSVKTNLYFASSRGLEREHVTKYNNKGILKEFKFRDYQKQ